MRIVLYNNLSEKNKLNKTLQNAYELNGVLKEETSVLNPDVLIEIENPTNFNYAHIPEFGRYYFIKGFTSVRNGLWRISLNVDVLYSFKDEILNLSGIVSNSETNGADNYLNGDVWKSKVKETTSIINFPSGLSENGHFILITAGG